MPQNQFEGSLSESSLPEKIVAIDERLGAEKIAHAFGGALALAYYAQPRATIDIDVNVFVAPARYPDVAAVLAQLGAHDGPDVSVVERDGQCRLWWSSTPIDLFFAYDDLHDAMRRALRRQPFADTTIPVLAPEHLIVCKAIFNRPKDWVDIGEILLDVDEVDLDETLRWLDRIVGPDDPRRLRLKLLIDQER